MLQTNQYLVVTPKGYIICNDIRHTINSIKRGVHMEFIDVLDERRNKVGIVRNRELVYKNGDWHKTVHIWLINSKNELLIQKRAKDKQTFPNLWAISIAGHVISGETSIEAALREIKEEIDVDVNPNDLKHIFTIKRIQEYKNGFLHVHDDVYLFKYDLDLYNTKIQKEELTDIRFINYKELEEKLINKDPSFVPFTEEHENLFKYLKENIGD